MLKINLFDSNGIRNSPIDGSLKKYKYIEYVDKLMTYEGTTIFTDNFIFNNTVEKVKSKIKIAWLVEPKAVSPKLYDINDYLYKFDYVLTHDESLLLSNDKIKFCPTGECWITECNKKIHDKTKNISFIFSHKNHLEGQRLRHDIFYKFNNKIDCFGNAISAIKLKDCALIDYRYSICVENNSTKNYFTEKLIDCFMTGTIPIYWGCQNLSDYFDVNGIICFNNLEELYNIINNANENLYSSKIQSIKNNFELAKKYCVIDDWLYENILKDIC